MRLTMPYSCPGRTWCRPSAQVAALLSRVCKTVCSREHPADCGSGRRGALEETGWPQSLPLAARATVDAIWPALRRLMPWRAASWRAERGCPAAIDSR